MRERAAQLAASTPPAARAARPSAPVAPTMIGSATVRESRLAWSREKPRQRAAGEGDAVAGDAGGQRRRLGDAEREAVGRGRLAAPAPLRPAVGERPSPPRRRAGPRRSRAGRRAAARSAAPARSRRPPPAGRRARGQRPGGASSWRSSSAIRRRWPISSAAAAPACRATSKLLRSSGSISLPVPAGEPGDAGRCGRSWRPASSSAGPWTRPSASAARGRQRVRRPAPSLKRRWCRRGSGARRLALVLAAARRRAAA